MPAHLRNGCNLSAEQIPKKLPDKSPEKQTSNQSPPQESQREIQDESRQGSLWQSRIQSALLYGDITSVVDKPGLFLSKICEKEYDGTQVLVILEAIHNNLINQILITSKKSHTVNSRKCLIFKFTWVKAMWFVPAKFLVFTVLCVIGNYSTPFILPGIGINGVLAVAVCEDNLNSRNYDNFLKHVLILTYASNSAWELSSNLTKVVTPSFLESMRNNNFFFLYIYYI
ncbi:hypothetical protein VP01_851g1 [Puccinia sorghi]|uniref:Uncharacterized protein n=1 Tax=Puccinia sorghi TaxID=27349 RepID=A0A0L6U936_9BASI|nr:hypothetical protein VP01_851g1 [Puccinia sorghi]